MLLKKFEVTDSMNILIKSRKKFLYGMEKMIATTWLFKKAIYLFRAPELLEI